VKWALVALGVLLALPYACAPVYRFPAPVAFSGDQLFNPYERTSGSWQRANLHAHGRAWLGITSGRQSNDEVVRRYRELGYSVPGVSNYHQIAAHDGVPTIAAYEHGYNIRKHHQLAIGAQRVDWLDFPIWQSRSHLQYIINRVAATADLVALVHPESRNAYGDADLQALTSYHLIEVVNGKFPHDAAWDAALSSGRAVWGIGNDDNHDLEDLERLGVAWTMIDAASASTSDVVGALRAGRSYAVLRINAAAGNTVFGGLTVRDGVLNVTAIGEPSDFDFIGQNGAIRKTVTAASTASYAFEPTDTYIRVAIRAPRTTMYLNPVLRYGGTLPAPAASIDPTRTMLQRAIVVLAVILVGFLLYRRRRKTISTVVVMTLAASPAFGQSADGPRAFTTSYGLQGPPSTTCRTLS
jgi:hypothetical protein